MSVLQILLYEEPGSEGSEDDSNKGHSVGRDNRGYSGVVNSQIGQRLVDELCSVEINIRPSPWKMSAPTWTTFSSISCFTVIGLKGEYAYEVTVTLG